MKQIRKRLTYANVMSSIAVFLVLGGATALAASQLGKNTVGSKQLKNNAVTTAKLKNKAVTGAKVKDGSLSGGDINVSTLGTVPSATNATNATNAKHATSADSASGLTTLPSGKSESGFFAAGGGDSTGGYIAQGITFQQPLAASIPVGNVELIEEGEPATSICPGVGRAAPNHVCLYTNEQSNVEECCIYNYALEYPAADKNGFIIYWDVLGSSSYSSGEWTVTAP